MSDLTRTRMPRNAVVSAETAPVAPRAGVGLGGCGATRIRVVSRGWRAGGGTGAGLGVVPGSGALGKSRMLSGRSGRGRAGGAAGSGAALIVSGRVAGAVAESARAPAGTAAADPLAGADCATRTISSALSTGSERSSAPSCLRNPPLSATVTSPGTPNDAATAFAAPASFDRTSSRALPSAGRTSRNSTASALSPVGRARFQPLWLARRTSRSGAAASTSTSGTT